MRFNKTRIILVVMIVSTILLGGVAVFVGWRLQQNQTTQPTDTQASNACEGMTYKYPERYCSKFKDGTTCCQTCVREVYQNAAGAYCRNDVGQCHDENGGCGTTVPVTGCGADRIMQACAKYSCDNSIGVYVCYNKICRNNAETYDIGNRTTEACSTDDGSLVPPTSCNRNGVQDNGETGKDCGGGGCGACAASVATTPEGCRDVGGCWNAGTDPGKADAKGCTAKDDVWCGPGNCVPGRTDLCKYKCVGGVAGNPGTLGNAVNQNVACVAGSCQTGYCLDIHSGSNTFGECISKTSPNASYCTGDSSVSCQKCSCSGGCSLVNGVAECRKNCVPAACNSPVGACEQLDFNCPGPNCGGENINNCPNCSNPPTSSTPSTSRSSSRSSSIVSSITPASLSARAGGRVYCQDTGGQPIPIVGAIVAVTVGSTTINTTTDSDGYYTSSDFTVPVAGVNVEVDVASLPSTFNNGLSTSQLENKFAEYCATPASIPGCSGGVASNYYCNSSAKTSYANCKYTKEGEFRGFRFKYTNCSSPTSICGDGTVDEGEACDPVGSVGQCTSGGKCLNGCACPTCNSKCTTNDQCPDGYACSNGSCRNPSCPNSNECSCDSIPSTAIFDDGRLSLVFGFVLIILGILLLRSKMVIGLLTPALVGVFGNSILKYIDPDLARKEYEKKVIKD